jgi:hypothetical protein
MPWGREIQKGAWAMQAGDLLLVLILIALLSIEHAIWRRGSERRPLYVVIVTPEEHKRIQETDGAKTRAFLIVTAVVIMIIALAYLR